MATKATDISFRIYFEWRIYFEKLSPEQIKRLMILLFDFCEHGDVPVFGDDELVLEVAFTQMSNQIVRDKKSYEKRCERNAQNARMRWDANAYDGIQTDANDAYKYKDEYENKDESKYESEVEKKEKTGSEVVVKNADAAACDSGTGLTGLTTTVNKN